MRGRGGPAPYVTLGLAVKVDQGAEAHRLHSAGLTFAEVADRMGMSLTTAWRRARWYEDLDAARHDRLTHPPRPSAAWYLGVSPGSALYP